MRGGTLFSGIGAPECAMPWIDWRWCAEIDPFASAVHAARFPNVPNLGDVNEINGSAIEPVDLVVFGSPCQSFSVAGKRLGLDDPRGNMALVGLRVIGRLWPKWVVWENVPGVLSSEGGRDFAAFLGLLGELGYGFAYRILDAQHAGVPQRRRRVFVVGCLGDWRPPAAVLFEPESLRGDSPPSREAGQISPTIPARSTAGGGLGTDFDCDGGLIAFSAKDHGADHGDLAPTLRAGGHDRSHANAGVMPAIAFAQNSRSEVREMPYAGAVGASARVANQQTYIAFALGSHAGAADGDQTNRSHARGGPVGSNISEELAYSLRSDRTMSVAHSLRADGFDASEDGTGRGTPLVAVPIQSVQAVREKRQNGIGIGQDGDPMFTQTGRDQHGVMTLDATRSQAVAVIAENGSDIQIGSGQSVGAISTGQRSGHADNIAVGMSVRRLMPVECERLQGLPDGWTDVTYRGKPAADGPRYRAIGNSMAVPVVRWIGQRIRQFEDAQSLAEAAD